MFWVNHIPQRPSPSPATPGAVMPGKTAGGTAEQTAPQPSGKPAGKTADAVAEQIAAQIAGELGVKAWQVKAAVDLLDGGSTVPFIARYRKEATGTLGRHTAPRARGAAAVHP